jgi:E3 ubiquitin-protein ligase MUL1
VLCDQAIKDDVGTIRIQRPHKGPFYASPKSIDQLILNLGKWAKYGNDVEHYFSLC